ncbi:unnamed protein product [Paramecium primaurelia]|uniref:Uncharacterized protein n=2 Tax=Paramecium TaxID=5884 RepID=A0A8S1UX47_9CILI|nr:unnamed protein product [Paramecium primaurelia]CAD8168129.1 unnamed protein product [Paramecium pentaurelia]
MKSIYQDMLNRAYNTLFHPSVQWFRILTPGYNIFRYPAPASEQINHVEHDFKTPYRDSKYYVRHDEPVIERVAKVTFTDPLNETPTEKLVRLKLLTKDQVNNSEAVQTATQLYEQKYGLPLSQKVYSNQVGGGDALQDFFQGENIREVMASFVRQQWEEVNENALEDLNNTNLDDDYHPNLNEKVGFNLQENDPLFRQLIVDLHTVVKNIGEKTKQEGHLTFFRGDPNYWHVLDNSFPVESIRLIQNTLGDEVSQLDPKALSKQQNREDYHIEHKVQVPIENKYYS